MKFKANLLRLYFNQGVSSSDKQWSIDQGEGTIEILAQAVFVRGCNGVTRVAPGKTVSAWLEYGNVLVQTLDNPASVMVAPNDADSD